MAIRQSFIPAYGSGQTVAPDIASASVSLGGGSQCKSLQLVNLSATLVAYVRCGTSAAGVTATTADLPVLPNSRIVIGKDQSHDTVAHISPGGTGSLHILPGEGHL
jgi:hypothetical protein